MNRRIKSSFIALFYFFVVTVDAKASPSRMGYAYDNDTRELIYIESHHEEYQEDQLIRSTVFYTDPQTNLIAKKYLDFRYHRFMPDFELINEKNGHKEKARYISGTYTVRFSESFDQQEKTSQLRYPEDAISDAGFDNFIIKHWQELIAGKVFKRHFLIPSMMDFVKFRIYQESIIEQDSISLRRIVIEPANFILRAFADEMVLLYDLDQARLRRFVGISNMRDSQGDNYQVVIDYTEMPAALTGP